MKRYLLFGGSMYYACGGWEDFIDSFDSIDEGLAAWQKTEQHNDMHPLNWCHIVDSINWKIAYKEQEGDKENIQ